MGQDEAVAVLRTYDPDNIDSLYAEGTTTEGRSWAGTSFETPWFHDLPPAPEIAHCVLIVWDNDGRKVEVTLEPGGIVTGKRLSPGVWQYRLDHACHALARAGTDLASGPWWNGQLHKVNRSVRRRWQRVAQCLAAGLLLASVWILWRRVVRCGLSQAPMKRDQTTHSKEGT
jgi:hypothetical protein